MNAAYFSIILLLLIPATISNGVLLYIIRTRTHLNTLPNRYLSSMLKANLASEFLVALSTIFVVVPLEITNNTLFCLCVCFAKRSLLAATTLSILTLSVDRFRHFVQHKIASVSSTRKITKIVWLVSFGYAFCCLLVGFFVEQIATSGGSVQGICSSGIYHVVTTTIVYMADFCGLFLIPFVVMTILYYKVIRDLWYKPYANLGVQMKKRKSILMNIAVTCLHMLFWVPVVCYKVAFAISFSQMKTYIENQKLIFASLCVECFRFLALPLVYFCFSQQAKLKQTMHASNQVQPTTRVRRKTLDILANSFEIEHPSDNKLEQKEKK